MSSSESEDEEELLLAKYGSPLEELDDPEVSKKPIAVHEQIVTDEQGRRRFHGAFTGGFSAGYYNTVDTPEGWTPSSFRSSRKDRKANKSYAPEDFMDEEDMSEYGIAPKKIVPQSSFASSKNADDKSLKRKEHFANNATMLLGLDMLQSLVIPVSNNIGIRLLQKMGWKSGQGVGPKVKRPKKNAFLPDNVEFAPDDCVPMEFVAKENAFGLGYTGMDPKRALHDKVKKSSAIAIRTKSGAKLSFAGHAFGVGAYEEEDNDIYAQDSMANYDLELSEEKKDESYGWSKPKKAITGKSFTEAIEYVKKELANFQKAERTSRRKIYAPPILPPDYDPNRRLNALGKVGSFSAGPQNQSVLSKEEEREKKFDRLGPEQRGELLGEKKKKPDDFDKDSSIFLLLKPKDRERLQVLKHGGVGQPLPPKQPKKRGFYEPYASNPAKQARYSEYLKLLKSKESDPYNRVEHDTNMTEWEREQEREEFVKSSRFFQPLSATMSSRFATESEELKHKDAKEEAQKKAVEMKMFGLMTRESFEWHPDRLLCKRFNIPNPYPHSDIVGIPGKDSATFGEMFLHPDDFKSKKMPILQQTGDSSQNVKNSDSKETGIVSDTKNPPLFSRLGSKSSRWDQEPIEQLALPPPKESLPSSPPGVTTETQPEPEGVAEGESDDGSESADSDGEEGQGEPSRPSMDLFKAIFASSDSESSSDDESDSEVMTMKSQNEAKKSSKVANTENSSQTLTDTGRSEPIDKPYVNQPIFHQFKRPAKFDSQSNGAGSEVIGVPSEINKPQFHKFTRPSKSLDRNPEIDQTPKSNEVQSVSQPDSADMETCSTSVEEDSGNLNHPHFHEPNPSDGDRTSNNETEPMELEQLSSNLSRPRFHKFSHLGEGASKTETSETENDVNQRNFHKFTSKKDRLAENKTPSVEDSNPTSAEDAFGPRMPPGDSFGPMLPPLKIPKLWESIDPENLKAKKKSKKSKHKKHKHKKEKKEK